MANRHRELWVKILVDEKSMNSFYQFRNRLLPFFDDAGGRTSEVKCSEVISALTQRRRYPSSEGKIEKAHLFSLLLHNRVKV